MHDDDQIDSPENIEIYLLMEAIFRRYGYDFRDYGKAHTKRRVHHRLALSGISTISELIHKVLYDESFFQLFLQDLSINTTEMFRDPEFFKEIREHVLPILSTYPFIKIWHAGCSSGEEVYSMAILLEEENLYDRTQMYGTDFNHQILDTAREGIYSMGNIRDYTHNYTKSGGKASFSDYYNAKYDSAIIESRLKKNVVFSDHNLVTDAPFGEMNLIMCRNTLIYFNKTLQDKVIKLFFESLIPGGYLCIGSKESLAFSAYRDAFEVVHSKLRIYKKKY